MKSGKNESAAVSERARRGFSGIETWVFDLDNTLYPHHLNLWQQVDARIRDYVADFLHVSPDEAFRLPKDYYRRFGPTTSGPRPPPGGGVGGLKLGRFWGEVFNAPPPDLEPKPQPQVYARFLARHN